MSFVSPKAMEIEMPSRPELIEKKLHQVQQVIALITLSAQGQLMEAMNSEIRGIGMKWTLSQ